MYAADHPPAHVHVLLRDGRESIVELESLKVTGQIRPRDIRIYLQWIETNQTLLRNEWQRLNP